MKNPFEIAQPVQKKLKVLLYGTSGSGKTFAALTFPGVAVIDTEAGSDLYAGRPGIPAFSVLRARTLTDVENAVRFIQQDNGKTFQTLVIDSITVLYNVQMEATARGAKNGEMGYREWAKVNNRMKAIYTSLINLPVHVIVIARETTEYETVNGELRKSGVKPDADKSLVYNFDFVVRMNSDHSGVVQKSRGITGEPVIRQVNWDWFAPHAVAFSTGAAVQIISEDAAAAAESESLTDREIAAAFITEWRSKSLTDADVLTALGVTRLSEWGNGRASADQQVQAWLDQQLAAGPAQPVGARQAVAGGAAAS